MAHISALSLLYCGLALILVSQVVSQSLLIKGGTVVNADREFPADVLVEGGLITQVAEEITAPKGAKVVDASGKYVIPGGIDPHTHLAMPFMGTETIDDYYSGQSAALAGGTTYHIDFVVPVEGDVAAGVEAWKMKAEKAVMDYSWHAAVTTWNDKVSADLEDAVKAGINSFKFFMAYKNALMVTDETLLKGFAKAKELGALPMVHGENGDAIFLKSQELISAGITGPEGHHLSRPPVIEAEATGRAIKLAQFVNVPLYVVHVMSEDAMLEVARARLAGQRVIGEAITGGVALNESGLWNPDFKEAAKFVMSPPIRPEPHRHAIKAALKGGALSLVGTDHCVFNAAQKAAGRHDFRLIPNGINGLEERLVVLWDELVASGEMTPSDFVRITSTAAAQIFNIYPQKGVIAPGSDADIAILDPSVTHTISVAAHHSRLDTNIYDGRTIRGKVVTTISQGKVVWDKGQLNVSAGAGRYIPLKPFGPLFTGLDKQDATFLARTYPYGPTPVKRAGDKPVKDEL